MPSATMRAGSLSGRGTNVCPGTFSEETRSTRNVRQSSRSRSKATRYQRRSVATSRCGSTRRSLPRPSWAR